MLILVALAGCGGDDRGAAEERRRRALEVSGPGEVVSEAFDHVRAGRYGAAWELLVPGQQRLVARPLFERCLREAVAGAPIPVSDVRLRVIGVRGAGGARAVRVRLLTPVGELDRTLGAERAGGGGWRWLMPPGLARPLQAGRCPGAA